MKKNAVVPCVLAGAVTLAPGCVERAPELTPAEREQLREYISTQAPDPAHDLDISFENRVRLVGYDVDVETVTPGVPFTITWYWHAVRRLDAGWQLFTHVADGRGENRLNQDAEGLVRQIYQPGRWHEGEYIRDVQRITLPQDWNSDRAVFYVGLWNGPHRLAVRSGPNDGENRARAASLPVATGPSAALVPDESARPAVPPPPSLRAARAAGPITIDGNLEEPSWQQAQTSSAFVNTVDGSPAELRASVRTLWDDTNLYVAFEVDDPFLRNTLQGRDAHLWEQDAVEIMIDPDGDGENYYELQVSPTAQVFDTRYERRRIPAPFGHVDWNANVEARVAVRGRANDDADDQGYSAEIAIAWSSLADREGRPLATPPPGSTWRMNFYVMDTLREGSRAAGWSPPLERDFHVPARFGRVTFAPPPIAEGAADPRAHAAALIEATPRVELPPPQARALKRSLRETSPGTRALRPRTLPTPQ